tara:strand:+ start:296 stop:520 length:225 start_codon:yes stop_codon:yes gene_type:complete
MEELFIEELTTQEIEQHYSAAMDSVNLINSEKPSNIADSKWSDTINRNKEHLKIMINKDFWTNENLTPLQEASR